MSTVVKKPATVTQRSAEAVRQAAEFLGLDDQKVLTAAMVEAALEGVRRNPSFASHVRNLYQETISCSNPKTTASRATATRTSPTVELQVRKYVRRPPENAALGPDPYCLFETSEDDQLPIALDRYKVPELKLAAERVQRRNPGTKPTNKSNRQALVDYIVHYVT